MTNSASKLGIMHGAVIQAKLLIIVLWQLSISTSTMATHSMGLDLTYECLGGDTFALQLTFYRDCGGINAPGMGGQPLPVIDISSVSCGQNFTATLQLISFQELNAVCSTLQTTCSGGPYPGVEEYIYRDTIVIPDTCSDWIFSNAVCCRNNAINTINPTNVNIYVETTLDNLNTPCNNSPVFTNTPVPFMCLNAPYCFNNGAIDPDGDSLVYTLITPTFGPAPGDTVNYLPGYSPTNPVTSSPPLTFDALTGDICITPTVVGEVSVMQVRIEEWRNGVQIGYIDRDIQLRVIDCVVPNTLPLVDGINGTGIFTASICAGDTFCFFTNSIDPDTGQTVTMSWNGGISAASFNISAGPRPVGNFCWLPDTSDISFTPHCFTVTIMDDNCPFLGIQTFSFCITVFGFVSTSVTTQDASCPGVCDGQSTVSVSGGVPPYVYLWDDPSNQTNATATNLCGGNYTVTITDSVGCNPMRTITIIEPPPIVLALDSVNVSCNGGNDGQAIATSTGGTGNFTYLWDSGAGSQTTSAATGLIAGTYSVTISDANGCDSSAAITILEPSTPIGLTTSSVDVPCFGDLTGSAIANPTGGTPPYTYAWNDPDSQVTATATGLVAGSYSVTVTDNSGDCKIDMGIIVTQPSAVLDVMLSITDADCFGNGNGAAIAQTTGGTAPYTYQWDSGTDSQTDSAATGLVAGTYSITITDANGCQLIDTNVNISQPTASLAVITSSTNVSCKDGSDGSATSNVTGGTSPYTYLWDDPGAQTTQMATGLVAGTYSIAITDANACTTTNTVLVSEPATNLVYSISVTNALCYNDLSGSATITPVGGVPQYTYTWDSLAGEQTDSTAVGLGAGSYGVTVTDASGCQIQDTTITISEPDALSLDNLGIFSSDICIGESTLVGATYLGADSSFSFSWDNSLGAGLGPFTIGPLTSTTYTITIMDACGNTLDSSTTVVVSQIPPISLNPVISAGCMPLTVEFENQSPSSNDSIYTWSFGNGDILTGDMPTYTFTNSGTYTITVTLTTTDNCTATSSGQHYVEVYPLPQVTCSADPAQTDITNPIVYFNGGANDLSYSWNFGDDDSSFAQNPTHTYSSVGTYDVTLNIVDSNDCMNSCDLIVSVDPVYEIIIPNAFTPDPNGPSGGAYNPNSYDNDIFFGLTEYVEEYHMMIFNRWGELIFETFDINIGWDGYYHGRLSQQDVYAWKINVSYIDGKEIQRLGDVTLIR